MTVYLRQSTASQEVLLGYFVDSTDGDTEATGLTIANTDIKIWKSGATTLANKNSGGATHISNGLYYAVLDATDTNTVGPMIISVHVAGALTVRLECCVLTALVYDSLIAGSDNLQVDILQAAGTAWGSGAITAASIASSAITSAKFATGAITATVIAADAIGASELAADAVTEIVTGVWNAATASYGTAGSYGELIETNLNATVSSRASQTSLDTLDDYVDTEVGAIKTVTDKLDTALELDGAVYRYTTNALEQAPSGGGGGDATEAKQDIIIAALAVVDSNVDDILTDTGTTLPASLSTIQTSVNDLPTNAELATALSPIALEASVTVIDGNVDAIKAKTDSLTFTVAGQVDANAESMNGAEILGNGTSGDLWRGS